MANVKLKEITLVDEQCCSCGIDFMVPGWFQRQRREDGGTFHCPAGHPQVYSKPEIVRLREQVKRLESRNVHLADQRQAAERSAAAFKGQVTQLRKRVANGVCPCCSRTFAHLARHMATKHPRLHRAEGQP